MKQYKIRVNNEAESREAQELFFELGYAWNWSGKEVRPWRIGAICTIYEEGKKLLRHFDDNKGVSICIGEEITLPQLRDLVVLHRNSIDDANWVTEGDDQIYEDSSGKSFIFREQGWAELQRHEMRQAMWEKTKPKPQTTENEQGLISGADALSDYKNAQVSYVFKNSEYKWFPLNQCGFSIPQILKGYTGAYDSFTETRLVFRLKPRTVKLEIEVPAPFEPTVGERYWHIAIHTSRGYSSAEFKDHPSDKFAIMYGAWRTEAEIKIVVEQLRKLRELGK